MFAYNFAVAHLGLRHTIANSFMLSDVFSEMEGWKLIDKVNETNICKNFPKGQRPHVIHYCQTYYIGSESLYDWWVFGKRKLRKDFISCEAPLLKVPPDNLADYEIYHQKKMIGNNANIEKEVWERKYAKRESFMVCEMIRALNDAAIFFKDEQCKDGTANYNFSYVFH
ncbi:unnamed protein product [Pseudo-nitzschia multistriata]|uniref:Uncharacterized protein n=1 Tax=Pseudo-nitzschia multistriata TaxID=183589 RepID=A0A448Z3E0_9STRA|nr:unnamed protein product [Pseudo-nitzschia multistriata]